MSEDTVLSSEAAPSADFEGALQDLETLAHEGFHPITMPADEEALNGASVAPTLACLVERLTELGRGSNSHRG